MDIIEKRRVKGGHGNAAAEYSDIISRACSWQRGGDASHEDIDAEKMEEDLKFGIAHRALSPHEVDEDHTPKGGRSDGVNHGLDGSKFDS